MLPHKKALIVVAKRPAPGRTKTRLSPPLTPGLASSLYERFLFDTLDLVRGVKDAHHVIAYLDEPQYFLPLAPDFELIQQEGNDLGERLDNALNKYLSLGCEQVVIMNSDSPTLPPDYLSQAFEALSDGADVVLGPCDDGGYYLIGMTKPAPRLLREVQMSTPTVAEDTMALAREEGLRLDTIPVWYDVDDIESLARLIEEFKNLDAARAKQTRMFLSHSEFNRFNANGV